MISKMQNGVATSTSIMNADVVEMGNPILAPATFVTCFRPVSLPGRKIDHAWTSPFVSRNHNANLFRRRGVGVSQRSRVVTTCKTAAAWQQAFEAAVLKRATSLDGSKYESIDAETRPQPGEVGALSEGFTAERIRKLLNSIWRLSVPFWKADRAAVWHALATILLRVIGTSLGAVFTTLSGSMITALSERQVADFTRSCVKAFALIAFAVPLTALTSFVHSTFVLRWKQFLTKCGLGLYFEHGNYYKLANLKAEEDTDSEQSSTRKGPDNPDEVIQDQFSNFAQAIVDIVIQYIESVVEIVLYSAMLLRVFPPLYFFILIIVAVGMLLINKIGKRLVNLEALRLRRAADFRFSLARVRIHAESIAFYNGARVERTSAEEKLDAFARTVLELVKVQVPVDMFICSFYYLPSIVPTVVLAPLLFAKKIQLGQLTMSISAFHTLYGNLSIFVGEYDRYSSFGASVERLSRFVATLEKEQATADREFNLEPAGNGTTSDSNIKANGGSGLSLIEESNSSKLQLKEVSVDTPNGRSRILEDISFSLRNGERLLIVGATGRGKTSLLRAIAGLWTNGSGTIIRPTKSDMFFMPQRPYCPEGSLREQLLYPARVHASNEELEMVLSKVGLSSLPSRAGGFDAVQNWTEYLSVGETQRLAFARLFLSKPSLVLIDEGTSALDLNTEGEIMRAVKALGCTVVSIGHRPSLVQFHDRVLHLSDGGNGRGYSVVNAETFLYPGMT